MKNTHYPVIIIGSGPAGYTAAIYTGRAMLSPLVLTGLQPGGQLTITTDVENYPGFAMPIQGPWLVEQMALQAANMGATLWHHSATSVDLSKRPFTVITDNNLTLTCDALILATGAKAKWLGLESEAYYMGGGVSACATCDGFFYRNKPVIVVGGGNSAVEEAMYLSNIASSVTIIHRRDSFKAEQILQERLFKIKNINIIWNSEVEEIIGQPALYAGGLPQASGVIIKNRETGSKQTIAADGIFIAIGHSPSTELVDGKLKIKPNGYIWTTPGSTRTSIDGVFAAGDVADDIFRQAVTAAGTGCMAALEAEKYLSHILHKGESHEITY